MSQSLAGGPDSLARLRADLARLAGVIDELGARVERLADRPDPPAPPGPVAPTWVDVDPDQAPGVLVELARWIAAVLAYHRVIDHLHPCWYRHPGLVQALLDVRAAWLFAYREPGPDRAAAALDWWQRQLPQLERQVRELLGRCSSGRHEPAGPAPRVGSESALRGYAHWWAADRHPATEPPPAATGPAATGPPPAAAGPATAGPATAGPATAGPGNRHGVPRPRESPGVRPASEPGSA